MKITRNKTSVKRFGVLLLAVLVIAALFCLPVSAEIAGDEYMILNTNMTITVPEGALLLGRNTQMSDPAWQEAGILSPTDKLSEMSQDDILAEIHAFDGKCVIAVQAKESDYAKSIFNLNDLNEESKANFLEYMQPSSADESTGGTIEWYEHEQIPFFCIDIYSTAVEESGEKVHERLYCTLYDGMIVSFDLYTGTDEIPDEYDALMRAIVDSAVISEFQETPGSSLNAEVLWVFLAAIILIGVVVAFFIYRSVSNKREKKAKALLANQLTEYRRKKEGHEDEGSGELRFVNETLHDDNAIKIFANYQAYRRHIFMPIFTILLGFVAIVLVMKAGTSDNWWMLLLLVVCVVFSAYKTATAGTTITKALMRVFNKLRSRKAIYYFYDGDFRITGLQASNLHPYFQITAMYETKEYFYMYFGEDNTYYVKKDGFTQGEVDAFRKFMKEKLGKKFR